MENPVARPVPRRQTRLTADSKIGSKEAETPDKPIASRSNGGVIERAQPVAPATGALCGRGRPKGGIELCSGAPDGTAAVIFEATSPTFARGRTTSSGFFRYRRTNCEAERTDDRSGSAARSGPRRHRSFTVGLRLPIDEYPVLVVQLTLEALTIEWPMVATADVRADGRECR